MKQPNHQEAFDAVSETLERLQCLTLKVEDPEQVEKLTLATTNYLAAMRILSQDVVSFDELQEVKRILAVAELLVEQVYSNTTPVH